MDEFESASAALLSLLDDIQPKVELPYEAQPRQALLHASTASEILFGGAAGGGKSHALRWDLITARLRPA